MSLASKPRGRRTITGALAALALAVVVPEAAIAASPGQALPKSLQTAIAPTNDIGNFSEPELNRLRATGAQSVRLDLDWGSIAPATPAAGFDPSNPDSPGYNWSFADRQIMTVASHGLEPLVYIDNAPTWALLAGPPATNTPDAAQMSSFATAAARRYDGTQPGIPRVREWAIWNEPNWSYYLFPQRINGQDASVDRYRDMVNAVASAVHSVHADNVAIAGELFPNGIRRGQLNAIAPLQFARELFCLSPGSNPHVTCSSKVIADVISVHPYTSGGPSTFPADPDNTWIATLPKLTRLVHQAQMRGTLISNQPVATWVTEFAWNTNPPRKGGVPITLAQRWIAETMFKSWAAGVSVFTWFGFRDDPLDVSLSQSGLYYACTLTPECDMPKPTLTAFRFPFVAYLQYKQQVSVWGRTPPGMVGPVRVQVMRGSSWVMLATLSPNAGGIFSKMLTLPPGVNASNAMLRAQAADRVTNSAPFSLKRPKDILVKPFV